MSRKHFIHQSQPPRFKCHRYYVFNPLRNPKELSLTFVAVMLGLFPLAMVEGLADFSLLAPSFGATALLIFAAPFSRMAQPRNVIGGHMIAAFVGLLLAQFLPNNPFTQSIAVALAIVMMLITDTAHPPGGATAFMAFTGGYSWMFLLHPILPGALWLVFVGWLIGRISPARTYPDRTC